MNKQFWIFVIWYRIISGEGLKKKVTYFNVQLTEPLCLQKYALRLQYKTAKVLQIYFLFLSLPFSNIVNWI